MRQFGQGVGNVEQAGLQGLAARKGQQLAHQAGRPVGVLAHLDDVGETGITGAVALQQQIAKADHRGQQIVEIMGDAAGQLAHRLHFLRLGELRLEIAVFRGIDEVNDQPGNLAVLEGRADEQLGDQVAPSLQRDFHVGSRQ